MSLNKMFLFFLIFCTQIPCGYSSQDIDNLPFSRRAKEKIKKFKIITISEVDDYETEKKIKKQKMNFKSAGLHKKTCPQSIPRMFNYESYKDKIDMITISQYNDTLGRIYIQLTAPIIKKKFGISFKIPRITKPGTYQFIFDRGFLKGLKGTISITPIKKNCLYFMKANWEGPHSNYPNLILKLFSKTAMDLSTNKLFRISGSH